MGILSGHESWLLYYDPAIRVCFDCQTFSTIPFYTCPKHLDWQAEDKTSVNCVRHEYIRALTCFRPRLVLVRSFHYGQGLFTLCNHLPAAGGLPDVPAHSAAERWLFASQLICAHPAWRKTRTGCYKAANFPKIMTMLRNGGEEEGHREG